jgi:hypothetical protein
VRRAKLYYLRGRVGKRARVRERRNAGIEQAVDRELLHPVVPSDAAAAPGDETVAEDETARAAASPGTTAEQEPEAEGAAAEQEPEAEGAAAEQEPGAEGAAAEQELEAEGAPAEPEAEVATPEQSGAKPEAKEPGE